MAKDYAPITATALRLITKFGGPMTFRAAGSIPDPVTGLGGTTGATRTVQGVMAAIGRRDFPDTLVEAGDKALLIEGTTINMSDKWVNGAEEWAVVDIQPIMPNGADIVAVKVLVRA